MSESDMTADGMLEAVRGSLRAFPNAGGDIVVMQEVERITREARLALLKEMASAECPACKDGAKLFRDEETGRWEHGRGEGMPSFLCQAPEVIAERLVELEPRT